MRSMRLASCSSRTLRALLLALTAGALLGACASDGSGDSAGSAEPAQEAAPAGPPKGVAPPAGHPLAQVETDMRPDQVRKLLGEPDSHHRYPGAIWKNFIPFYFGADSGTRVEYGYTGQGRVVFAVNRWSGQETVVRVDYDPSETGD